MQDSHEFLPLSEGDKKALKFLVKAGEIVESIQLQIDDHNNLPLILIFLYIFLSLLNKDSYSLLCPKEKLYLIEIRFL